MMRRRSIGVGEDLSLGGGSDPVIGKRKEKRQEGECVRESATSVFYIVHCSCRRDLQIIVGDECGFERGERLYNIFWAVSFNCSFGRWERLKSRRRRAGGVVGLPHALHGPQSALHGPKSAPVFMLAPRVLSRTK